MDISAVPPPVQIKLPEPSALKVDVRPPEAKSADVQNGAAADGTRLPKPTVLAALPPGQGTRVDQLA
jgi:hypothetical protein